MLQGQEELVLCVGRLAHHRRLSAQKTAFGPKLAISVQRACRASGGRLVPKQSGIGPPRELFFSLERSFEPPARRQQVEGGSAGGEESYTDFQIRARLSD